MPLVRSSGKGGPSPDPKALRRNAVTDVNSWIRLPPRGLAEAPAWPAVAIDPELPPTERHFALWDEMWTTYPQAHVWKRQRMAMQVATYTYLSLLTASGQATGAYIAQWNRLADVLLINPHAMRAARCVIDEAIDEVVEERTTMLGIAPVINMPTGGSGGPAGPSARDRLSAPQAVAHEEPDPEDDDDDEAEAYLED